MIDPDGLFETEAEAKAYAKEHKIKTGFFRNNKIVSNKDGSFSIDNKKAGTSTFQDRTLANEAHPDGVYEAPMVAANDVMSMNTKGGGFSFDPLTQIETLRDGSERKNEVQGGEGAPVGPGGALKGYNYIKTIGKKYNVFEKVVKAKDLSGQARAVFTQIKNMSGKTIRYFKDAFKIDGRHYERANKYPYKSRSRKLD
ncbi:MAG: hypothetical protein WAT21_09565 [Saprospiraceae bacterium]